MHLHTEAITFRTDSPFVSSFNEVERIAQAIESWPSCEHGPNTFCECYGTVSFKELAEFIRNRFGEA